MTRQETIIYLDYHATTPVDLRVAEKVMYYMTNAFGNANSVDHIYGDEAAKVVKQTRQQIAELINASPKEIIFTSGATESINLAIQGYVSQQNHPCKIIVSPVEHKAVLDTCAALAKKKLAEIVWLKVNQQAQIDLEYLEKLCAEGAALLCVMAANNEVGTIYPTSKIGAIASSYNIPFLCDASQAVGKIPLNFQDWGITYLAISGHKLYAPKGVGALVVKKGHHLQPIIYGGGHQQGIRSGTLNVPGIVGLGEACHWRRLEMEKDEQAIALLRNQLQNLLQSQIPDLVINGDLNNRLSGNLHIAIPNIPNSAIIARVRHQLAISTGAACSSGVVAPSHVLQAMNLPENLIEGALRIGIGKFTTKAEIEKTSSLIINAVNKIQLLL
ncbi:cysteine desulfurase family protein [Nodularia spumigena CS-591/04]|uniref:cysteine desulfurase family protein n=1 Tax=Nodularia spumigena TaxID=70799 RepID=UPI002330DD90|nr:cysteine desulfurase family protein [Nodularia spumigena]MDB9321129.1 cysteine desulfurase family protein [Nodularia spumigena CS-591/07A]MDB9331397.1 cysteine desulfurase family protein [Nodularia spumigena CS-591/04]MDB9346600.1 cysteine desulfurase family protein [Nodularia spumigena CS-588/01]MDB9351298.1 cysteine desulfurase family protein [Nodularia spumigena CS-588/05]MDB9363032.1 cysteine desulfurase family protein [Nodularia spumigena CS-588/02]